MMRYRRKRYMEIGKHYVSRPRDSFAYMSSRRIHEISMNVRKCADLHIGPDDLAVLSDGPIAVSFGKFGSRSPDNMASRKKGADFVSNVIIDAVWPPVLRIGEDVSIPPQPQREDHECSKNDDYTQAYLITLLIALDADSTVKRPAGLAKGALGPSSVGTAVANDFSRSKIDIIAQFLDSLGPRFAMSFPIKTRRDMAEAAMQRRQAGTFLALMTFNLAQVELCGRERNGIGAPSACTVIHVIGTVGLVRAAAICANGSIGEFCSVSASIHSSVVRLD